MRIRDVINWNTRVLKEIRKFDSRRVKFTSLYWLCDTLEILVCNVMFLPFIYYAVQLEFPPVKYLFISLIMFLFLLSFKIFSSYYNIYYKANSNEVIRYNFQKELCQKNKKIDMKHLEKQEFYDKVNMLVMIGDGKMLEALDMICWAATTLILIVVYLVVIISFDPVFLVLAIIGAVIVYKTNVALSSKEYEKSIEEMSIKRKIDYTHRIFSLPTYADDIRTSEVAALTNRVYKNAISNLMGLIKKYTRKIVRISSFRNIIMFFITTTLTTIYLGFMYLVKKSMDLTVGEIVIIQTNTYQLCYVLSNISSLIPGLKKNALYLQDYYEYMEYEPEIQENEEGLIAEDRANAINIKNASFSYDENNKVLKNINLSIKAGEKIAIVGYNGAGKSTLIKLILRLYLPQEGEIELDNVPADKYNLKSYRDRFGVAFQNSVVYAATVAENILMQPVEDSQSDEMVAQAINKCGLANEISKYPEGIHTTMTKEFDDGGVELSGGQKQKIALSRVFAKKSGVIILDEPSSALDPISEYEMYKNMLELSEGRTFIVISHRLSITKDVDRIILLENGEIAESGSHQELINKGGKYAEMWNIQAKQYT